MSQVQLCGSDPRCVDPTRALDLALANVRRCYAAGVLERADDTLSLLRDAYPRLFPPAGGEPLRAEVVRHTSHLDAEPPAVRDRVAALAPAYDRVAHADLALWRFVKAAQEARLEDPPGAASP